MALFALFSYIEKINHDMEPFFNFYIIYWSKYKTDIWKSVICTCGIGIPDDGIPERLFVINVLCHLHIGF